MTGRDSEQSRHRCSREDLLGLSGTPIDDSLAEVLVVFRDGDAATDPMIDVDERDRLESWLAAQADIATRRPMATVFLRALRE